MNKNEDSSSCLQLITQDKDKFIHDMLEYYYTSKNLQENFLVPMQILSYTMKKTHENYQNIFFSELQSTFIIEILLRIYSGNDNKSKEDSLQIVPFINLYENSKILDLILDIYEKNAEIFWKKHLIFVTFFYRNCQIEKKLKQYKEILEKLEAIYQKILKEKLINLKKSEKKIDELLILIRRVEIMNEPQFFEKNKVFEQIQDDYQFCYETFINFSADFERAKIYFTQNNFYVFFLKKNDITLLLIKKRIKL